MSIFSKPVTALCTADLQELIEDGAIENVRLEFKREFPDKDETLKKLSSFANTYGGYIVIGADADAEGKITGLPGVERKRGFKQQTIQWCYDAASPPIVVSVSDGIEVPGNTSRVAYVQYVAESDLAPHFLNGRKGAYVRTDEFSQRFQPHLATELELAQLTNRRQVITERRTSLMNRARERFSRYVLKEYDKQSKNTAAIGARFSLFVTPRYPAAEVCTAEDLLTLVKENRITWRNDGFPHLDFPILSQHESAIVFRPGSSFSFFEATTWGTLYYAAEAYFSDGKGIHLNRFVGELVIFVKHAALLFEKVGLSAPVELTLRLDGVENIPWVYFPNNNPTFGPHSILDDSAESTIPSTPTDLVARSDGVVMQLLRFAFLATNWPSLATDTEELRLVLKSGYKYGFGEVPDNLQE